MTSWRRVAFNLFTFIPGTGALSLVKRKLHERSLGTGGTVSARYCYSVWMRHLVHAADSGVGCNPNTVAELGPGDSLGVGITALLTGASKYYAFDVVPHASAERNLAVFREVRELLRSRADIPDSKEFPEMRPWLPVWSFPAHILSERRLAEAMSAERLLEIERSVRDPGSPDSLIQFKAPWSADNVIQANSVDLIFSQAVLEHVDDLATTYTMMRKWLRPSGYMSHVIDFRSHGWTRRWNGHWACSDLAWKLIRGRDVWSINRMPLSEHIRLMSENGFRMVLSQIKSTPSEIKRRQLSRRFRSLSDADLTTSGAFLIARQING
jgi:SAM-dependent methyltransferase